MQRMRIVDVLLCGFERLRASIICEKLRRQKEGERVNQERERER